MPRKKAIMTEIRQDTDKEFLDIISADKKVRKLGKRLGEQLVSSKVVKASADADLVALCELRSEGYTHAVSPKRAQILEDLSPGEVEELKSEIQHAYRLDRLDLAGAVTLCEEAVRQRRISMEDDMDWKIER
jgi:hypothetical protein